MKRGISFDSVWEIKSMHKPYAPTSHPITLPQNGVLEIGLLEYGARRLRSKIPETPEFADRRLRPPFQNALVGGPESGPESGPETPTSRRLRGSFTGDSGWSGDSGLHGPETPV